MSTGTSPPSAAIDGLGLSAVFETAAREAACSRWGAWPGRGWPFLSGHSPQIPRTRWSASWTRRGSALSDASRLPTGDRGQARQGHGKFAHVMLDQSVPSVPWPRAWLLACRAMGRRRPGGRAPAALRGWARTSACRILPPSSRWTSRTTPCWVRNRARRAGSPARGRRARFRAAPFGYQSRCPSLAAARCARRRTAASQPANALAKRGTLRGEGPRPLALASALEDLGVITVQNSDNEPRGGRLQPRPGTLCSRRRGLGRRPRTGAG